MENYQQFEDEEGNLFGRHTGTRATVITTGGASFEVESAEVSVTTDEDGNAAFNFGESTPRVGYVQKNAIALVLFHDEPAAESASW